LVFASEAGAAFEFVSTGITVAVVDGASAGASGTVFSTETLPLKAGIEIRRAESMKTAAAIIVIFESTVAVPRGPNALLEILLVNSAPASVLPGCSSTTATSTIHDKKKIVYKT